MRVGKAEKNFCFLHKWRHDIFCFSLNDIVCHQIVSRIVKWHHQTTLYDFNLLWLQLKVFIGFMLFFSFTSSFVETVAAKLFVLTYFCCYIKRALKNGNENFFFSHSVALPNGIKLR